MDNNVSILAYYWFEFVVGVLSDHFKTAFAKAFLDFFDVVGVARFHFDV